MKWLFVQTEGLTEFRVCSPVLHTKYHSISTTVFISTRQCRRWCNSLRFPNGTKRNYDKLVDLHRDRLKWNISVEILPCDVWLRYSQSSNVVNLLILNEALPNLFILMQHAKTKPTRERKS